MDREFEYLFRVVAKGCDRVPTALRDREFERWTDALYHAKSSNPPMSFFV